MKPFLVGFLSLLLFCFLSYAPLWVVSQRATSVNPASFLGDFTEVQVAPNGEKVAMRVITFECGSDTGELFVEKSVSVMLSNGTMITRNVVCQAAVSQFNKLHTGFLPEFTAPPVKVSACDNPRSDNPTYDQTPTRKANYSLLTNKEHRFHLKLSMGSVDDPNDQLRDKNYNMLSQQEKALILQKLALEQARKGSKLVANYSTQFNTVLKAEQSQWDDQNKQNAAALKVANASQSAIDAMGKVNYQLTQQVSGLVNQSETAFRGVLAQMAGMTAALDQVRTTNQAYAAAVQAMIDTVAGHNTGLSAYLQELQYTSTTVLRGYGALLDWLAAYVSKFQAEGQLAQAYFQLVHQMDSMSDVSLFLPLDDMGVPPVDPSNMAFAEHYTALEQTDIWSVYKSGITYILRQTQWTMWVDLLDMGNTLRTVRAPTDVLGMVGPPGCTPGRNCTAWMTYVQREATLGGTFATTIGTTKNTWGQAAVSKKIPDWFTQPSQTGFTLTSTPTIITQTNFTTAFPNMTATFRDRCVESGTYAQYVYSHSGQQLWTVSMDMVLTYTAAQGYTMDMACDLTSSNQTLIAALFTTLPYVLLQNQAAAYQLLMPQAMQLAQRSAGSIPDAANGQRKYWQRTDNPNINPKDDVNGQRTCDELRVLITSKKAVPLYLMSYEGQLVPPTVLLASAGEASYGTSAFLAAGGSSQLKQTMPWTWYYAGEMECMRAPGCVPHTWNTALAGKQNPRQPYVYNIPRLSISTSTNLGDRKYKYSYVFERWYGNGTDLGNGVTRRDVTYEGDPENRRPVVDFDVMRSQSDGRFYADYGTASLDQTLNDVVINPLDPTDIRCSTLNRRSVQGTFCDFADNFRMSAAPPSFHAAVAADISQKSPQKNNVLSAHRLKSLLQQERIGTNLYTWPRQWSTQARIIMPAGPLSTTSQQGCPLIEPVDRTSTGQGFWLSITNQQESGGGYSLTITSTSSSATSIVGDSCYQLWHVSIAPNSASTIPIPQCPTSEIVVTVGNEGFLGFKICRILTLAANTITYADVDVATDVSITVFRQNAFDQLNALTTNTMDLEANALSTITDITTAALDNIYFNSTTNPYLAQVEAWNAKFNATVTSFNQWADNATAANSQLVQEAADNMNSAAQLQLKIASNERDLAVLGATTMLISAKVDALAQARLAVIEAAKAYDKAVNDSQQNPVAIVMDFMKDAPASYDWNLALGAEQWTQLGQAEPIICNPIPPSGCISSIFPDEWLAEIFCWELHWLQNMAIVFVFNIVGILLMPIIAGLVGSQQAKAAAHEIYPCLWSRIYEEDVNADEKQKLISITPSEIRTQNRMTQSNSDEQLNMNDRQEDIDCLVRQENISLYHDDIQQQQQPPLNFKFQLYYPSPGYTAIPSQDTIILPTDSQPLHL